MGKTNRACGKASLSVLVKDESPDGEDVEGWLDTIGVSRRTGPYFSPLDPLPWRRMKVCL